MLLTTEYQEVVTESPFLYLTCDLPPPPLFKDETVENIIPQVRFWFSLQYKENFNCLMPCAFIWTGQLVHTAC